MSKKKNSLTREEAGLLYEEMRKQMQEKYGTDPETAAKEITGNPNGATLQDLAKLLGKGGGKAPAAKPAKAARASVPRAAMPSSKAPSLPSKRGSIGQSAAIGLVLIFACAKIGITVLEKTGVVDISEARASLNPNFTMSPRKMSFKGPNYTREEVKVLKALDARRIELDERMKGLEERKAELDRRDREFAAKLTEIRELSQRLQIDRERNEQRKDGKLKQLASVYGSMNPEEAAQLMEQLDVTIALSLIQRMPEKRIGQILSMMSPDRALVITRMLSGSKEQ